MAETNTTLASFNVDRDAWEKFKALAAKEGRSASYGLNELIKQALQRESIDCLYNEPATAQSYISDIEAIVSQQISEAIASLSTEIDKQINQLSEEVEDIKKQPVVA